MKLLMTIFLILTMVFLLFGVTIFLAGTCIFVAIQTFYEIESYSGIWTAYFSVIAGAILFAYIAFVIIRDMFCNIAERGSETVRLKLTGFAFTNKFFIGFVLYEILKLLYLKKSSKK